MALAASGKPFAELSAQFFGLHLALADHLSQCEKSALHVVLRQRKGGTGGRYRLENAVEVFLEARPFARGKEGLCAFGCRLELQAEPIAHVIEIGELLLCRSRRSCDGGVGFGEPIHLKGRVKGGLAAKGKGSGKGQHGGFGQTEAGGQRRQRAARIAESGAEFGKLQGRKVGVGCKLLERPFALHLLHGLCELSGVKAVGVEFDAHRTKIGHDLVELRAGGELGDGAEPFGGLFCRRADGTKPGTGGLPGGPELLKSLRGNPGGLCRPAEVRLDLLQGSVDDGKIAGRFLRAVRPYFNAYRRRAARHFFALLLRFSASAAWADKKAASMLRSVNVSYGVSSIAVSRAHASMSAQLMAVGPKPLLPRPAESS